MSDSISNNSLEERILSAYRNLIVDIILSNNRIAEKLGCNPSDLQMLHIIELTGSITPKELTQRTNLTTGGVTVILDRLEKESLIKREKHPTDRRSLLVTSNWSKRREEIAEAYAEYAEGFLELLSHYTNTDKTTILHFLEEVTGNGNSKES